MLPVHCGINVTTPLNSFDFFMPKGLCSQDSFPLWKESSFRVFKVFSFAIFRSASSQLWKCPNMKHFVVYVWKPISARKRKRNNEKLVMIKKKKIILMESQNYEIKHFTYLITYHIIFTLPHFHLPSHNRNLISQHFDTFSLNYDFLSHISNSLSQNLDFLSDNFDCVLFPFLI